MSVFAFLKAVNVPPFDPLMVKVDDAFSISVPVPAAKVVDEAVTVDASKTMNDVLSPALGKNVVSVEVAGSVMVNAAAVGVIDTTANPVRSDAEIVSVVALVDVELMPPVTIVAFEVMAPVAAIVVPVQDGYSYES